ncbi:MAG: hypothetical protein C4343_05655, partial [Chloroflexota bacterium]
MPDRESIGRPSTYIGTSAICWPVVIVRTSSPGPLPSAPTRYPLSIARDPAGCRESRRRPRSPARPVPGRGTVPGGRPAFREESAVSLLLVLKAVHVLSAIVAVGANVTYGFWLRLAGRDRERLLFAIQGVRWLDRRLANPMYGVVFVTGVLMVLAGAYSFETGWIAASIVLYVLVAVLGIA